MVFQLPRNEPSGHVELASPAAAAAVVARRRVKRPRGATQRRDEEPSDEEREESSDASGGVASVRALPCACAAGRRRGEAVCGTAAAAAEAAIADMALGGRESVNTRQRRGGGGVLRLVWERSNSAETCTTVTASRVRLGGGGERRLVYNCKCCSRTREQVRGLSIRAASPLPAAGWSGPPTTPFPLRPWSPGRAVAAGSYVHTHTTATMRLVNEAAMRGLRLNGEMYLDGSGMECG